MVQIPFTKMHGCGNDFILIECLEETPLDFEGLAKRLCHRRFGIGADQLLTVHPSKSADFKMEIYNADGGQVEMCGNGIRCFARYVYDHGLSKNKAMVVETLAGIVRPRLTGGQVEVDMGEPILEGRKIPVNADGKVLNHPLEIDDSRYLISCVSMGNPHCVIYCDDVEQLDVGGLGSRVEFHPFFPNRVNVEFVQVLGPKEVRMRVWERGAGETWACGTGACAATVAGALMERTHRKTTVHLKGGDLTIDWRGDKHVYMTGAVEEVFQGTVKA